MNTNPVRLALALLPFVLGACAIEDAFRTKSTDEVLLEARAAIDAGRITALHRLRLSGTFTMPDGQAFPFLEVADPPVVSVREMRSDDKVVRVEERAGLAARVLVSSDAGETFAEGAIPVDLEAPFAAYSLVRFGWLVPLLGSHDGVGVQSVRLGEGRQIAMTFGEASASTVGTAPLPGILAGGRVHATLDARDRLRHLRIQGADGVVLAMLSSARFAVWDGATLPSVWRLDAGSAGPAGAQARLDEARLDWEPGESMVESPVQFAWTPAREFPSDRLYEVQESLFGSELATGSTTIDALGRMVLNGKAGSTKVQMHVTEAGRFRWNDGAALYLYDTLEDRGIAVRDGRREDLDEQETVFRSWLYRAMLFRPIVLESLNGTFADDGSIVMATRSMGRSRISLQLRVWVDTAHTRIERYTLTLPDEEGRTSGEARWGARFQYDEGLRVRRIVLLQDGVETPIDVTSIERGVEIADRAFQDPSWSS